MHVLLMDVGVLKLVLFDIVLELHCILIKESVLVVSELGILNQGTNRFEDLQVFAGRFHDRSFMSILKFIIIFFNKITT